MSLSSFKLTSKKEKNKYNSNSSYASNNSRSDSSSFQNNNFNQNFFNDSNNINKSIDSNSISSNNEEFFSNTNTKYSSNVETRNIIMKEKNSDKKYLSKNSTYESKDISNTIEETTNNNNPFKNIFKFLNNPFGFNINHNNNNNNNNNNINNNNNNNNSNQESKINGSTILKNIQTFFREKFSKPITNWIIKSSAIKILRKIGEGGSSDIFLGLYRGTKIAEKRLHLINIEKNINEFKREVASFILLHHPYLLLFLGVIAEPKHLSIITEYCPGGNLHELLFKKKYLELSWKLRKQFLLQIAIGMNFLHTNNPPILHRDLKSLNIFLTNDMKKSTDMTDVKIADFGLSVRYEQNCKLTERVGTCLWMAPEVIKTQKYTTKSDVYSYGIIMWEVCTREMPYDYFSREKILYRVSERKERPNLKRLPNDTPKEFEELMQKCWDHDPNLRPDFDAIIDFIKDIEI